MSHGENQDFGVTEFLVTEAEEFYAAAGRAFPTIDASVRTDRVLPCLKEAGIQTIIRYYCRNAGASKVIGRHEAEAIIGAGLKLCIVSEFDAEPTSFSYASGLADAEAALKYAKGTIGQPDGSAIYFAVDFDATKQQMVDRVIPYFQAIQAKFREKGARYRIGVYGSGATCGAVIGEKLADLSWLAQSTGWSGYQRYRDSRAWALLQGPRTHACKIEVDFDEASGSDFGAFDRLDAPFVIAEFSDVDLELEYLLASSALDGLDPDLEVRAKLLIKKCADKKIKMVPSNGVRSPKEQASLWRQARSEAEIVAGVRKLRDGGAPYLAWVLESTPTGSGKDRVTNALPGCSWHQWGLALDCYREIDGKPNWDPKNYTEYADLAESKEVGLVAGGHWTHFKDWPHVQLTKPGANSPLDVYTLPQIDAEMRRKYSGGASAEMMITRSETHTSDGSGRLVDAIKTTLSELSSLNKELPGNRPYFFPNGILKIDVALGILAEPPSSGGEPELEGATPLLSGRVTVTGIDDKKS